MAKNKVFNVHDLYPKDYSFNYKAFEADPEGYQFTAIDFAEVAAVRRQLPLLRHRRLDIYNLTEIK